ncbi:MAG: N-(5'-phosphoribosyl)anthranilate isomerase [Sphingomonadales bacterium 32-68-7]|nr:MAG: N-(5'-phosphoribosyl)anthranilate isomerase [Sphingomonadales bacterium 12-68-11]OYX08288.1 MAG: N-(5'-phosphoribosyl)anthranilate isomerase [Sphingomonadales bacterium 32-68-7]
MSEPLIKICGLSTPEAVDAAVDAGATHVGLVHYAPSPRHVTLEQAAKLRARVPPRVKVVLLLVNEQPEPTARAIAAVKPDVVQFHGTETPEWLAALKQHTPLEIWKAFGVRDAEGLARSVKFKDAAHRILYDAPANKLPGGNGLAIDWDLFAQHKPFMPWGLAGGLTPDNVADAIRQTGAPLVDTSSGVESAPGVKDVDRIRAFCQSARNA